MLLRLAIFGSLAFAMMSGVWATFADPTPENASKILNPTPEKIAEANSLVTPVLQWIFSQTPDSIAQLFKDAKEDVADSIKEEAAATSQIPVQSSRRTTVRNQAGAPAPTGTGKGQAQQPGIDWYKGEGSK